MTPSEYSKLSLDQLCDKLTECELEQYKIYQIYRRAADFDETMRELKKNEEFIRIYMSVRTGVFKK